MFDIFYIGSKPPGVFSHEKPVKSVKEAQQKSSTRYCWIVNYLSDYTGWDFLWEPAPWESDFMHAWPSQWQKDSGTYLVPKQNYTGIKYHTDKTITRLQTPVNWNSTNEKFDYSWHPDPSEQPYIYQFGTQWQKTGGPCYVVPGATSVKYVTEPRINKTEIDENWEIPESVDFGKFDYTWHPDGTEQPYIYQFGTQWQKTGGPKYVVPGATDIKYVEQLRITAKKVAEAAIIIDHFDGNANTVKQQVEEQVPVIKVARYYNDYLGTLRRVLRNVEADYVWIVSSVCDYSEFDFSWHPEQWQSGMIHVFPSNEQKFGDTFFINVKQFNDTTQRFELLEWHDTHFVSEWPVPRFPPPVIEHKNDTHVDTVKQLLFNGPVGVFTNSPSQLSHLPAINLWRESTKAITPVSKGASTVVVPSVAVPYIKTQLYDYPEIDKTHKSKHNDQPLDIVFISNGESVAEENWNRLLDATANLPNRVHRVDGVNGRVNSFKAAWDVAKTDWVFHVVARLEVNKGFDWNWQPDRMQQPKHYIFHAHNPINGLEYGHTATVAYNKKLGLHNDAQGLDFTTNQLHEVVPLLSGTSRYTDAWLTWRTSFREVIKLKHSLPDVDSEYRLNQWLHTDLLHNNISKWSTIGANDALEYYDSVQGRFDALRLTFEWDWLEQYLLSKHGITVDTLIKKAP